MSDLPCELTSDPKWKRGDVVCLKSSNFGIMIRQVMPCFDCDQGGGNPVHSGYEYDCTWMGPYGQPFRDTFHEDLLKEPTA